MFVEWEDDIIDDIKKSKSTYVLSALALLMAVSGISLSFLVLDSNLSINGISPVEGENWKLFFDSLSDVTLIGEAKEIVKPYIEQNATSIKNFNISLSKFNDTASYDFRVVNKGEFNAEIASITYSAPFCSGNGVNALEDAKIVCNNLEYAITYENGDLLQTNDKLSKSDERDLKLTVKYIGSKLPSNSVKVDNLSVTVIYGQSDGG